MVYSVKYLDEYIKEPTAVYWTNRCVLPSDTPAIKFAPKKAIA